MNYTHEVSETQLLSNGEQFDYCNVEQEKNGTS